MQWFRSHHGAPSDAKLALVAKATGRHRAHVTAVWWEVLDHASQQPERGTVAGLDPEILAIKQDLEAECVNAILDEFARRGMIADGRVSNWEKRQPKREDASTGRVRRHRSRTRGNALHENETQCNADETHGNAPEEEEKRGDTEKSPPAEEGRYAFRGRVIRLTPADFEQMRALFHAIPDLVAELATIDGKFAADPPKGWYNQLNAWLNTKHQRLLTERKSAAEPRRDPNRPYAGPEVRSNVVTL